MVKLKRLITAIIVIALAVPMGGCETLKKVGEAGYGVSCLAGAAVGAVAGFILVGKGAKSLQDRDVQKKVAAAAAAGCIIGLAATAVGKMLSANQQKEHEESVQRAAKRQAQELQNAANTRRTYQQQPTPGSEAEKKEREAKLAKEMEEIKKRYEAPDTQDLGEGAQSTVEPVYREPVPEDEQGKGCFQQRVRVKTPTGNASEVQTMCPKDGKFVRVDVQKEPV